MNDGTEVGAESGGALCVAEDGEVIFETYASFEGNVAQALGKGGAVANYGSLVFRGTSVYSGNIAEGDLGKRSSMYVRCLPWLGKSFVDFLPDAYIAMVPCTTVHIAWDVVYCIPRIHSPDERSYTRKRLPGISLG